MVLLCALQEQLRNEFSPTGSGTGQMLRAVEQAFKNYLADVHSPLQSPQRNYVIPELSPEVLSSIEKSLEEWRTVCRFLRVDHQGQIVGQLFLLFNMQKQKLVN